MRNRVTLRVNTLLHYSMLCFLILALSFLLGVVTRLLILIDVVWGSSSVAFYAFLVAMGWLFWAYISDRKNLFYVFLFNSVLGFVLGVFKGL